MVPLFWWTAIASLSKLPLATITVGKRKLSQTLASPWPCLVDRLPVEQNVCVLSGKGVRHVQARRIGYLKVKMWLR